MSRLKAPFCGHVDDGRALATDFCDLANLGVGLVDYKESSGIVSQENKQTPRKIRLLL